MEKDAEPQKRQHCRTTVLTLISSFCSVASVAVCILLSVNAADMRNRVVDLESAAGEHAVIRASGCSADDLNSLIEQRVDELLLQVNTCSRAVFLRAVSQKSLHALLLTFQRSFENFVKIRTARQTSPECSCPPGKTTFPANAFCWCVCVPLRSQGA